MNAPIHTYIDVSTRFVVARVCSWPLTLSVIDLSDTLREYRIFVDEQFRKTIGLKVDEYNEQTGRFLAF